MLPTKIVVIGAGSASFGLNTVATLMRSPALRGSHVALVDRNAETLALIQRLAERMNREWGAQMRLSAHTHHQDALDGAGFVVSAIEVPPREVLWRRDYELTLKYGVRQPYAENGGPGGFAHTIRNVLPVLEIAHAMEQACPDAWFVNFSNPMVRICDAIARYSKIRVVGLCHQIYAGYGMVGYVLADVLGIDVPPGPISCHADPDIWPQLNAVAHQATQKVHIQAAGLNHFTWMLGLKDRRTGEDLYPLFRERWAAFDPTFEPLTRRVFAAFGLFPIPGDEHLCEYLPWLSDPVTQPWEKYEVSLYDWERNDRGAARVTRRSPAWARGVTPIDELRGADSEGAEELIEAMAGGEPHYHLAVNVVNRGQIANLPHGAIVETPGLVDGNGVQGVAVGALPEGIAELLRRELAVVRLCVDAGRDRRPPDRAAVPAAGSGDHRPGRGQANSR